MKSDALQESDLEDAKLRLGHRIQELREQADMTRAELGKRLGLTASRPESTVWNWEHGKHAPQGAVLVRMAQLFGVELLGAKVPNLVDRKARPAKGGKRSSRHAALPRAATQSPDEV